MERNNSVYEIEVTGEQNTELRRDYYHIRVYEDVERIDENSSERFENDENRVRIFYDHLGNNRIVVSTNSHSEQSTHYYPFGGIMGDISTAPARQRYKFGGKEYDHTHGLDWFDFEARPYDPAIMQFTSIDPLCEKYYHLSPYAYCANNPVRYIDPTGMYINIFYTDALGQQKSFRYERGMQSPVDDAFVNMAITSLNTLYEIEFAIPVMDALMNSKYNYDIVNNRSDGGSNTSQFSYSHNTSRYGIGGGEVRIPMLLNTELNLGSYTGSLGHELFHGYQREAGINPESINAEVDAYLFKQMVSGTDLGRSDTNFGKAYNNVTREISNGIGINANNFQKAVKTFKNGSIANMSGVYNHLNVDNSYKSLMLPLLMQYYSNDGLYQ